MLITSKEKRKDAATKKIAANWRGKAEAYKMAAFEIERNMKHD